MPVRAVARGEKSACRRVRTLRRWTLTTTSSAYGGRWPSWPAERRLFPAEVYGSRGDLEEGVIAEPVQREVDALQHEAAVLNRIGLVRIRAVEGGWPARRARANVPVVERQPRHGASPAALLPKLTERFLGEHRRNVAPLFRIVARVGAADLLPSPLGKWLALANRLGRLRLGRGWHRLRQYVQARCDLPDLSGGLQELCWNLGDAVIRRRSGLACW